jgi:hypothetical protein
MTSGELLWIMRNGSREEGTVLRFQGRCDVRQLDLRSFLGIMMLLDLLVRNSDRVVMYLTISGLIEQVYVPLRRGNVSERKGPNSKMAGRAAEVWTHSRLVRRSTT